MKIWVLSGGRQTVARIFFSYNFFFRYHFRGSVESHLVKDKKNLRDSNCKLEVKDVFVFVRNEFGEIVSLSEPAPPGSPRRERRPVRPTTESGRCPAAPPVGRWQPPLPRCRRQTRPRCPQATGTGAARWTSPGEA